MTEKKDRKNIETLQCRKGGRVTVPAEKPPASFNKPADSKPAKPTSEKK